MKTPRRSILPPVMEGLEDRCLLNGVVNVVYSSSSVIITGDDEMNLINVTAPAGGAVSVIGLATTINAKGTPPASGPKVKFKISLRGGFDQLIFNNYQIGGITADMGDGGGTLNVNPTGTVGGKLSIKSTGDQGIQLSIQPTSVAGGVSVKTGSGGDTLSLYSHVTGKVSINLGAGNDVLYMGGQSSSLFDSKVSIDLGGGNDTFHLAWTNPAALVRFDGGVTLKMGDGDDNLNINYYDTGTRTTFSGKVVINFGAGNDTTTGLNASADAVTYSAGAKVTLIGGPGTKNPDLLNLLDGTWQSGTSLVMKW